MTEKEGLFLGEAYEEGLSYFIPDSMMTQRVAMEGRAGSLPFQVSYNFSMGTRQNMQVTKSGGSRKYGAAGMSFRLLYDFLCRVFNGGEYFIDEYFRQIFKSTSAYRSLSELNDTVLQEIFYETAEAFDALIKTKKGLPDMRYAASKEYIKNMKVWRKPVLKKQATLLAEEIKRDIIACLRNGKMPTKKRTVSPATMAERAKFLSLHPNRFMYASGQLIEALRIYVRVGDR